jgi:hypothetical protein
MLARPSARRYVDFLREQGKAHRSRLPVLANGFIDDGRGCCAMTVVDMRVEDGMVSVTQ